MKRVLLIAVAMMLVAAVPAAARPAWAPAGAVKHQAVAAKVAQKGKARQAKYLRALGSPCVRSSKWRSYRAVCKHGHVARLTSAHTLIEQVGARRLHVLDFYDRVERPLAKTASIDKTPCNDYRGTTEPGVWGPRAWNSYAFRFHESSLDSVIWYDDNQFGYPNHVAWWYYEFAVAAQRVMGEINPDCQSGANSWGQGGSYSSVNNAAHAYLQNLGATTSAGSALPQCAGGSDTGPDATNVVRAATFDNSGDCTGHSDAHGLTSFFTDGAGHVTDADISMNKRGEWCTVVVSGPYNCDVQNLESDDSVSGDIAAHELQHALGVWHTCSTTCSQNLMNAGYDSNVDFQSYEGHGERDILEFLYGN